MYMKIYSYYQPYALDESSTLAELAQYQIFFSFFGSLIIQNSLLPSSLNTCVSIILILLNLSTSLLAAYFEYRGSKNERNDSSVEPIEQDDTNANTSINIDTTSTEHETSNPLQHRVDTDSNINDIEIANNYNNDNLDSDDDDIVDDNDDDDDDTTTRESHVQQIISKFESKKYSHPNSSNI